MVRVSERVKLQQGIAVAARALGGNLNGHPMKLTGRFSVISNHLDYILRDSILDFQNDRSCGWMRKRDACVRRIQFGIPRNREHKSVFRRLTPHPYWSQRNGLVKIVNSSLYCLGSYRRRSSRSGLNRPTYLPYPASTCLAALP